MPKKYFQQKHQLLGDFALSTTANSSVSANSSWGINITSNTAVIRIHSGDYAGYIKYNGSANSVSWDYYIPVMSTLDLYNVSSVSNVNIISINSSGDFKVAQY